MIMQDPISKSPETKHGLHKKAFLGRAYNRLANAAKRGVADMRATRADRHALLDQTKDSFSFTGTIMNTLREHDIVGANTLANIMQKARHKISDADAMLGSMAAGKDWRDTSKSTMRQKLFTDSKDNYLKSDPSGTIFNKIKVPSISAPIKEVAHVAVPMLAMDTAFKAVDKFRHPENAQQGQSMHNEYY